MFIIDDLVVLGGVGLVVLVVVSLRAVRRRRLNKKLDRDREFRAKVNAALDEADIEWLKQDVGAEPVHLTNVHAAERPVSRASSPIPIPTVLNDDAYIEIPIARLPSSFPKQTKKKRRRTPSEIV